MPAGHLYSEHNTGDNLVPTVHGTLGPSPYYSPSAVPNYHQLSTDASMTSVGPFNASYDHSGYLDNQSTSLYNMAAITTGHNDLAVTYQPPPPPPDVRPIPPGVPASPPETTPPPPVASPPGATPTPPPR
ncbi:predicted protein [Streptomyces sp. AA4]|nr:predicted protein [Streptomyces sp. AA4]